MRVTFTKHAERRMAQRRITESDIATLVRNCSNPDATPKVTRSIMELSTDGRYR